MCDFVNSYLLNYYVLKDSVKYISSNITYSVDTSNYALFKYALFNNAGDFYKLFNPFKADKYQLSKEIKGAKFPDFIKVCIENAYLHTSDDEKYFCYTMLVNYVVELYFKEYFKQYISKRKNFSYLSKMLDSYYFKKNEDLIIAKTNLSDYFFNSFSLNDTDYHLLEKPIKKIIGFFCTKQYYDTCYKNAHNYFNHFASSRNYIFRCFYGAYDIFFNHKKNCIKSKNFYYLNKIDTTILNLAKKEWQLFDKTVNYNIDELYAIVLKEAKKICNLLNDYFNFNQNFKAIDSYFVQKGIMKPQIKK